MQIFDKSSLFNTFRMDAVVSIKTTKFL